jgi:ABC-type transport system involved in multi-copper enzyme maturation permease subunit
MKYLAILKDSLREALDTKVFYVMVGISCLVMGITACLSFKPKPAQELMPVLAGTLNVDLSDLSEDGLERLMMHGMHNSAGTYEVAGYEPVNGAPDSPTSSLAVTLRARFQDKPKAESVQASPGETEQLIKDRFGRLGELRLVEAADVRVAPPATASVPEKPSAEDVYFLVTTRPTPATVRIWPNEVSLFFGALPIGTAPLGMELYIILGAIVSGLGGWVIILVSIIITAFFIPNMLRKGTVDLLLVKPIHRWALLLYKYTGGLLFIFLNTAVAVCGVWIVLGLRSGIWANSFLLSIFVYTFFFAVLYTVSTLFGVLTRSPIVSILLTLLVWFVLFLVGVTYELFEKQKATEEKKDVAQEQRWGDGRFARVVRVVHFVLPRTSDLSTLQNRLLLSDLLTANQVAAARLDPAPISWGESLTVSGVFMALMLGGSCVWFGTRDY